MIRPFVLSLKHIFKIYLYINNERHLKSTTNVVSAHINGGFIGKTFAFSGKVEYHPLKPTVTLLI